MKNFLTIIILAIILLTNKFLFAQDNPLGIYYFFGEHVSHRLNIMNDSQFVRTINNGMNPNIYKEIGNWKLSHDTAILYATTRYVNSEFQPDFKDTLYFKLINSDHWKLIIQGTNFTMPYKRQIEYHPNGNIKREIKGFWKYPLTGIITTFYESGKTKDIIYYRNGFKFGQYLEFNQQGIIITAGKWKKDKKVGSWHYYNEMGFEKQNLKK